jgi:nicotinamide-nucleotide amidase
LVVYATDLKHSIAGVRCEDLEQYGPVHGAVAEQLASGARRRLGVDFAIGTTGVAGPGNQGARSVGEVFIAVASPRRVSVKHSAFSGGRDDIRLATVVAALSDLVEVLDDAMARRGSQ